MIVKVGVRYKFTTSFRDFDCIGCCYYYKWCQLSVIKVSKKKPLKTFKSIIYRFECTSTLIDSPSDYRVLQYTWNFEICRLCLRTQQPAEGKTPDIYDASPSSWSDLLIAFMHYRSVSSNILLASSTTVMSAETRDPIDRLLLCSFHSSVDT